MWIYLVVFFVTVLFVYKADKEENIMKYKIYSVAAILLPCVIAGLRSESVGTDVSTYVSGIVDIAQKSKNICEFYSSNYLHNLIERPVSDIEIGYTFMTYIIGKYLGGIQAVLFTTQLIIMICIYKTLILFKESLSPWMGMLIYLLLFYANNLNHMRQGIAMAITFYAITKLLEEKYINYIILVCIAALFHISALMMLILIIIYVIIKPEFDIRKIVFISTIILLAIIVLGPVVQYINSLGIVSSRYFYYIQNGWVFDIGVFITFMPLLAVEFLYCRRISKDNNKYPFIMLITIIGVITYQLIGALNQGIRISRFFLYFLILCVPMSLKIEDEKKEDLIIKGMVVLYCILYFLYFTWYKGAQEIIPYELFIK